MNRSSKKIFLILFALGWGLRLGWTWLAAPEPYSDFHAYFELARRLLETGVFGYGSPSAYRLPGYPLFLAAGMLLSPDPTFLACLNATLSMGVCVLVFWLMRRLWRDDRVALFGMGVCACYPSFVFFSPVLATENLFAALYLLSLLCALDLPAGGRAAVVRCLLAGVFLGMGMLTRGEGLFYAPVVLVALWAQPGPPPRPAVWRVARSAVFLVGILGVTAPWYARNLIAVGPGAGLSTTVGENFYYGHCTEPYGWRSFLPTLGEMERNREGLRRGWECLRSQPGGLLASIYHGSRKLFLPGRYGTFWSTRGPNPDPAGAPPVIEKQFPGRRVAIGLEVLGFWVVMALAAVGAFRTRGLLPPARVVIWLSLLACWGGYTVVFFAQPRYRFTMDVIFCMLAGLGAFAFAERARGGSAEEP